MVLVFDLDDTLYPEREFVQSGLWAVARRIDEESPLSVYRSLLSIFEREGSGRIFNRYAELSERELAIGELVELYRSHSPLIQLSVESRIVLSAAKAKHRTALITDGPRVTQLNKFEALGLAQYIDLPIYTDEHGTRKPDKLPFQLVMDKFGDDRKYTYIGDNPAKDFQGPTELGWMTIRLKRPDGIYRELENNADHEITSLLEIFEYVESP